MKKKRVIIGIICAVVVWMALGIIDFSLVHNYRKPMFCICSESMQDGGSGKYVGLGYSFDIEGIFVSEVEPRKVTSYRGYIFGEQVIRGYWDEMLPGSDPDISTTE